MFIILVKKLNSAVIICGTLIIIGVFFGCSDKKENRPSSGDSESSNNTTSETPVVELSSVAEFDQLLAKNQIVLADFYADWCGPCHMLKPKINEIATEYEGKIKVVAVDIDKFRSLASRFKVNSIPDVKIFSGTRLENSFVGVQPKENYIKVLNKLMAN